MQRPVAVMLIGSGALVLWGRNNADPPSQVTVVAVADVPAGALVGAQAVELVPWPLADRPVAAAGALDEVVGRRATAAISAGEPLTPARVVGPGALASVGPDQVAVMLAEDPLASSGLVHAGDRVNVVGQTDAGPRTLVTAATVLTVTDQSGLIVAVPASAAGAVVQAAATRSAAVVLLSERVG